MSKVVLASDAAIAASQRMQGIVEGSLLEDLTQLAKQGEILSDEAEWRGPRADQFRSDWTEMRQSLERARQAVQELSKQAEEITSAIMAAGGGR